LSEIPTEWGERSRYWARMNKKKKTVIDGIEAPDRNEEYLLYQTLIGAWPVTRMDERGRDTFTGRITEYMIKASREAKVHTSWISPNEKYEEALISFIHGLLAPVKGNRFLIDFLPFQQMITHYGMYNSLSQTLLKICSPGVPDFYQGTELWDFSLVDPDNRRPVDFEQRTSILEGLRRKEREMTGAALARELAQSAGDGRIKMYVIQKALSHRRRNVELYGQGEYVPLAVKGPKSGNICAFMRRKNGSSAIIAVPRFLTRMVSGAGAPFGNGVWEDTMLVIPEIVQRDAYRNVFTGELVASFAQNSEKGIMCSTIFESFPVALLEMSSA